MTWPCSTKTIFPPNNAYLAFFFNTVTPQYEGPGINTNVIPPPGVWTPIDFKVYDPSFADAIAFSLQGILIITDGSASNVPDLAVSFQAPGAGQNPLAYTEQTIGIGPAGGARSSSSRIVRAVNGCIDFAWVRGELSSGSWPTNPIPAYPVGAAYGVNFTLDAVFMP